MKTIMVMFDSLNRNLLSSYGCDWTKTPNFQRLSQKAVTFETSYVCSMPCMPARRDLHTGRPNFLHRSWGPLEPWDESCMARMKEAGVHTHMVTDHQHYWEEGAGGNYLSKYGTHEMVRGQEGDPYYGQIIPPTAPPGAFGRNAPGNRWHDQDRINRGQIRREADMPQAKTFAAGLDFVRRHADQDRWVAQIETFDPHEPFFTLPAYQEFYAEHYIRDRDFFWDWPGYGPVTETPEQVRHLRAQYAALLSMCDHYLGKVLDLMDELDLWSDTQLIVWTDHGFLLGEHDCWAKCWLPFYEEVARTPFFMWDPRVGKAGERRKALVQPSIDLAPTLLESHGLPPLAHATGKSLLPVLENDRALRDTALFGMFGTQVNVSDGRHVYMRAPKDASNQPLFEYTLMPAHMREAFAPAELQAHELAPPFSFTQGIRPLRIPTGTPRSTNRHPDRVRTLLFDLEKDPGQREPIDDPRIESHMIDAMRAHLIEADAPAEQFERLGLS